MQNLFRKILYPKLSAFSLAEVLIVLSIIGIVATLTFQVLIPNYTKTQYVDKLKQAYSNMNQILMQMSIDNGTISNIDTFF